VHGWQQVFDFGGMGWEVKIPYSHTVNFGGGGGGGGGNNKKHYDENINDNSTFLM
jgi:hypothetical protein